MAPDSACRPSPFNTALLLANSGEVVTRAEICRDLWPADTFVDFDTVGPLRCKIREAWGNLQTIPLYRDASQTWLPVHRQDQATRR